MCYFQSQLVIGGTKITWNTTFCHSAHPDTVFFGHTSCNGNTHSVAAPVIWLYDEDIHCAAASLSCLLFFLHLSLTAGCPATDAHRSAHLMVNKDWANQQTDKTHINLGCFCVCVWLCLEGVTSRILASGIFTHFRVCAFYLYVVFCLNSNHIWKFYLFITEELRHHYTISVTYKEKHSSVHPCWGLCPLLPEVLSLSIR